jgi:hypothetical protein
MTSLTLIILFGTFLSILSLKFVIEPEEVKAIAKDLIHNHGLMLMAGIIPLLIGLTIIGLYPPHAQTQTPDLIVAYLGCIFFIIGSFRLLCRNMWIKLLRTYCVEVKHTRIIMIIGLIVGLTLVAFGLEVI